MNEYPNLLEQSNDFDRVGYDWLRADMSFELKSFRIYSQYFDTKFGKRLYHYLDSEPKYIISDRAKKNLQYFLIESEITEPCHLKLKETVGKGFEIKYIFVKIKPAKQTTIDESKK